MTTPRRLALVTSLLALGIFGLDYLVPAAAAEPPTAAAPAREIAITVANGYHPDRISATEGETLRLVITRQEYTGCTLEIVVPTLGIRRTLPPGEAVPIELGPLAAGEIPFHCGMNMIHGVIVVEPRER